MVIFSNLLLFAMVASTCSYTNTIEDGTVTDQTVSNFTVTGQQEVEVTDSMDGDEQGAVRVYTPLESMILGSQLTNYKVAAHLELIYTPIIEVVGLVGNTLSAIVMFQRENIKISCYFYMAVLAVADTVPLLMMFGVWIIKDAAPQTFDIGPHQMMCSVVWPITAASTMAGSYLIVAMTFDRLIAVKWPLKAITWCTMKRARLTSIFIILGCSLFKLPYAWITRAAKPLLCLAFQVKQTSLLRGYYWINAAITNYIPFVSLLVLNTLIIHTLRKRGKYFEKDKTSETSGTQQSTQVSNSGVDTGGLKMKTCKMNDGISTVSTQATTNSTGKKSRKQQKSEASLTIMLLMVTFSFLILTSPIFIFYVVYMNKPFLDTPKSWADYNLVGYSVSKLFQTNHAINFYLYCLGGSKFRTDLRKALKRIFTC